MSESRSTLRRVALMKGEPMPEFAPAQSPRLAEHEAVANER